MGDRTSSTPEEPAQAGPGGAERWADYLDWVRADITATVLSLTETEQRTSRLPSGWSPLELLSHVLHMEQRWFVWGFLGEPVAEPWGDWNTEEPWTSDDSDETKPSARWQVPPDVTAEHLADRLRALGDRTRVALRDHALDSRAAAGGRFADDPPTLEWICFHVLTEYARHAGHLDAAVEISSGAQHSGTTTGRVELVRQLYRALEDRDLDAVVAAMAPDVDWPHGWEGGRLLGRDSVRDYWQRQWAQIRPSMTVRRISEHPDGSVEVVVRLVVRDPAGTVLDRSDVVHLYEFDGPLVRRMQLG